MTLDTISIEHRRGQWWYEAPAPRRLFHRHQWETKAWSSDDNVTGGGYWTMRCACGATLFSDLGGWISEPKPRWR